MANRKRTAGRNAKRRATIPVRVLHTTPAEVAAARDLLGIDSLFPMEDRRPGSQVIAFLKHLGREDHAAVVHSLMVEAARADDWHERWLRALKAARLEKETVKKREAFARAIALDENPHAFVSRPKPPDAVVLHLYSAALARGSSFDSRLPEKPTPDQALSWLADFLGYSDTSTVRHALFAEGKRPGVRLPTIPGRDRSVVRSRSTR